jgi:hypothetical protein
MNTELQKVIDSLGIEYHATFVPQSMSRNAFQKMPSLNWRVTLKRNGKMVSTDYMQGIAHMPHYSSVRTADNVQREKDAAETAIFLRPKSSWIRMRVPPPSLADVMYSLVMDSDVLNFSCYEDWAAEFGYDPDSRSGEVVYHACRAVAIPFSRMFTTQELDALRTAYQDY